MTSTTGTTSTTRTRKALLCLLNIHHQWRQEHNPDGEAYRRCRRCGKDDPGSYLEGTTDVMGPGMM